jgi:hypothetical protein
MGEHQRVREIRMFFQHASDAELSGTVKEMTGRKVRAFVSGVDSAEGVAASAPLRTDPRHAASGPDPARNRRRGPHALGEPIRFVQRGAG